MRIEERIRLVLLLEKMYTFRVFSERLGLEDISTFHGKRIDNKEEKSN